MKLVWARIWYQLRVGLILILGSSITTTIIWSCGSRNTGEKLLPQKEEILPESLQELDAVWTGDFEEMVKRRVIRALVVYSQRFYFIDAGIQRGIAYEQLQQFEEAVNKKLNQGLLKVQVMIIPVSRENLIPALVGGYGDIALGNLTITPERQKLVDFSEPLLRDVSEILVLGSKEPSVKTVKQLGGQEIYVRKSSSYYNHLVEINKSLAAENKPLIKIKLVSEKLEDEDLLEMVNAGIIPRIVVDSHKAEFWGQIFDKIVLRPDIAIHTGGEIAWAFRKNSPKLQEVVNDFLQSQKQGTMMGNILLQRYLKDRRWSQNPTSGGEIGKLKNLAQYFQKYGQQYNFDWLMLAAQAYQESQFQPNLRSAAGAIGIMQVLPSTAADSNVNITNLYDPQSNIHAGTKYMRYIADNYFADAATDKFNRILFCLAAYNAGPNRIAQLRVRTAEAGLDPNQWFNNVERIVAQQVGRETVQYVSNIFKYYVAFQGVSKLVQEKSSESLFP